MGTSLQSITQNGRQKRSVNDACWGFCSEGIQGSRGHVRPWNCSMGAKPALELAPSSIFSSSLLPCISSKHYENVLTATFHSCQGWPMHLWRHSNFFPQHCCFADISILAKKLKESSGRNFQTFHVITTIIFFICLFVSTNLYPTFPHKREPRVTNKYISTENVVVTNKQAHSTQMNTPHLWAMYVLSVVDGASGLLLFCYFTFFIDLLYSCICICCNFLVIILCYSVYCLGSLWTKQHRNKPMNEWQYQ